MLGSHVRQVGGLPLRDPSWLSFTALCMRLADGSNRPTPEVQRVELLTLEQTVAIDRMRPAVRLAILSSRQRIVDVVLLGSLAATVRVAPDREPCPRRGKIAENWRGVRPR
jgi:hypothetical protein